MKETSSLNSKFNEEVFMSKKYSNKLNKESYQRSDHMIRFFFYSPHTINKIIIIIVTEIAARAPFSDIPPRINICLSKSPSQSMIGLKITLQVPLKIAHIARITRIAISHPILSTSLHIDNLL